MRDNSWSAQISRFIQNPCPLWDAVLSDGLTGNKFQSLPTASPIDPASYYTPTVYGHPGFSGIKKPLVKLSDRVVYQEWPAYPELYDFYKQHGLAPLKPDQLLENQAEFKLKYALAQLAAVPGCLTGVAGLVNCIQVVAADQPDYDVSYSHPGIPFTIFVSVCEGLGTVAHLRVAENILHEAMHLKLTLVEDYVPMVIEGSAHTYFSPWRETQRPVRGVLHALFVFRAIYDFYKECGNQLNDAEAADFADWRVKQLTQEFAMLADFPGNPGLTKDGAILSANLLPLN